MTSVARLARGPAVAAPALAVGVFMVLFFAWPIAGVIARGLGGASPASLLGEVLGSGSHRSVIWFTVWQAAASTALTVAVALPAAGAMARLRLVSRRSAR